MEMKIIRLTTLTGIYKSMKKTVLQLWSQDDGLILFNQTMTCPRFQNILQAWHLMMQAQEQELMISYRGCI